MLHTPPGKTKTETTQSKSQLVPQPERELHPRTHSIAGPYSLSDTSNAAPTVSLAAAHGVPPVVHDVLGSSVQPLDAGTRTFMEPRFGHDFSRIPIYPSVAGAIQTKLAINKPGDEYEQEADRISEHVMRMPEPQLQRACACGGACTKCQTEQLGQEHERLQTKRVQASDTGQIAAPPIVHEVLAAPGHPLDPATRAFMEPRFGYDFSRVRLHTGPAAEQSAREVNAHAYTVGNDIVIGAGRFTPGTPARQWLIAHELMHVLQQHDRHPVIQRQPRVMHVGSDLDFMIEDVEGHQEVRSVLTHPEEFLPAIEKKGNRLIEAEFRWLNNNLSQLVADAVVKEGKNPFTNKEKLSATGVKYFDKLVGVIAMRQVSKVGSSILRVINIGKKAAARVRGFGGLLALIGSELVEAFIGSLFDKTDEIVRKVAKQVALEVIKEVNDKIIPGVRASTTEFGKFMEALTHYISEQPLDPSEDKPEPKSKPKPKPEPKSKAIETTFSVGEGSNKISFGIDTTVPLTEERLDALMIDLAYTVLAIDEAVPKLESDVSCYQELALQAGIFSEDVAKAVSATEPRSEKGVKHVSSDVKSFRVKDVLTEGATKFDVPSNGTVAVTSSAYYDVDLDIRELSVDSRPPMVYRILLWHVIKGARFYQPNEEAVSVPRQYNVCSNLGQYNEGKGEETAEWYNLKEGKYYLSIENRGYPFVLQGNLQIDVRG